MQEGGIYSSDLLSLKEIWTDFAYLQVILQKNCMIYSGVVNGVQWGHVPWLLPLDSILGEVFKDIFYIKKNKTAVSATVSAFLLFAPLSTTPPLLLCYWWFMLDNELVYIGPTNGISLLYPTHCPNPYPNP